MRRRLAAAVLGAAALVSLPAAASAATARVTATENRFGVPPSVTLDYDAAPGEPNRLTLEAMARDAAAVELRDPAAVIVPGAGCARVDDHTAVCSPATFTLAPGKSPAAFDNVVARLGDRDDQAQSHLPSTIRVALLGERGSDELRGGGGPETLDGGPGADRMAGGAGDDTFAESDESARDDIDGGPGRDRLEYSDRRRAVSVDLAAGRGADGDRVRSIEDVGGGRGADRLAGSARANELRGGRGNDVLIGRGGSDTLIGSEGRDRLSGGPGRDTLDVGETVARPEADRARCGSGRDVVRAAARPDRLAADCERALLEGEEPDFFSVLVSQPLRAQRSGVVEVHLADPGEGERFRGQVALRFNGVLLGRPSRAVTLAPRGRATARVNIVGPALSRLSASRRLRVEVVLSDAAFTTVLRAPASPRTGTGGTPA